MYHKAKQAILLLSQRQLDIWKHLEAHPKTSQQCDALRRMTYCHSCQGPTLAGLHSGYPPIIRIVHGVYLQSGRWTVAFSIKILLFSTCNPRLSPCNTAAPRVATRYSSPSSPWLILKPSAFVESGVWTCHGRRCCKLGGGSRRRRIFDKGCIICHESLIAKIGA